MIDETKCLHVTTRNRQCKRTPVFSKRVCRQHWNFWLIMADGDPKEAIRMYNTSFRLWQQSPQKETP